MTVFEALDQAALVVIRSRPALLYFSRWPLILNRLKTQFINPLITENISAIPETGIYPHS